MSYVEQIRRIVPAMNNNMHKGQAGKVGVLGGSREYTGAPYYAAYSALKVGSDLSHIFCTEHAGTAIKSYSPELIVHPLIPDFKSLESTEEEKEAQKVVDSVSAWFPSLHVLIVGPGLGRDKFVQTCTKRILAKAKEAKLPLVIDGDGLYLLSLDPSIIKGYEHVILTPNVAEFGRLCDAVKIDAKGEKPLESLCDALGNITIVRKGATDDISNGKLTISCKEEGSPRRCGGQGDLLAGAIGSFTAWAAQAQKEGNTSKDTPAFMLGCYGACLISRLASRAAFAKHFRSTTTPNMIEEIGPVFEKLFPWNSKL